MRGIKARFGPMGDGMVVGKEYGPALSNFS